MLALADIGAQFLCLAEGEPQRSAVSVRHRGGPQHDDVDALVRDAVVTERAGDAPDGMVGVPWLHPRADALLKVGDDFVGDPAVDIRAGGGGAHGPRSFL